MGLRLFAKDESAPIPRGVIMELRCDGDHGLFGAPMHRFEEDGYVAQNSAAMRAGWLDRGDVILCPDCSGKKPR